MLAREAQIVWPIMATEREVRVGVMGAEQSGGDDTRIIR